eukprot:12402221-Karenia_brevis.AAC.1
MGSKQKSSQVQASIPGAEESHSKASCRSSVAHKGGNLKDLERKRLGPILHEQAHPWRLER